ncbi:MAG: DUF4301 family protein [Acidobacteriota bacterium]|nr:DUF4301 family protein [Acidobacteriota bacterium]
MSRTAVEDDLRAADREQLEAHGIRVEEARRQLAILRDPPPKARLVRPALLGDGIDPLPAGSEADRLAEAGRAAARSGRMVRFVPASGAASRLFAELRAAAAGGEPDDPVLGRFEKARRRFPFDAGPAEILERYGDTPKALIPFHRYSGGEVRTALEEHLVEAAAVLGNGGGLAALHFSVASRRRPAFEALLAERLPALERRFACRFEIALSHQSPATDSIAVGQRGGPFRLVDDPASPLLVRPGGHGALLRNLQGLADQSYDLIAMKNIDNMQPEPFQDPAVRALRILAGMALELARSADRPSRVCGVVPTLGTAGGGPFWVRDASGEVGLQIVETAQMDMEDAEQSAILARSTHFNPVFMVCAVLAPGGEPYRLEDYVDHAASFLVDKSHGGRPLTALERPGLWNGSMAGWKTRFVDLPGEVYTPVKTVFDLAGEEHQCPARPALDGDDR